MAISTSAIAGLAVLAVFAVGGTVAGILNSVTGQRVVAALRKDVSLRILGAPIAAVERMKSYRLQAILKEDIDPHQRFHGGVRRPCLGLRGHGGMRDLPVQTLARSFPRQRARAGCGHQDQFRRGKGLES